MLYIKRFLQFIFTLYGLAVFISFLLLIFPLVVAASFFGKIKGGNFIYSLCHTWADVFLFMLGIRTQYIYKGTPADPSKQYVFVFNHIAYMDIPFIMKAIRNRHFRVLGKAEMTKIPLFGFLYRNTVVLVNRNNAHDRAKSVMQLKSIIKKGISIIISPEGTFNMTHRPLKSFYDGAFRVAIETQTPIKPILFLDAYDRNRYTSIFSLTPGKSRIVYLDEVPVDGLTTKDVAALKNQVYRIMEDALMAFNASWIEKPAKENMSTQ
ncbi:MAG: 1-acyl-sn-glycerol-3-phosphate acyltransferase [Bacteroidetes bacterium]|nr:1-acyl-sn-glycerol-3-phosphate acyltransferase [Bacteroidota bacterium]